MTKNGRTWRCRRRKKEEHQKVNLSEIENYITLRKWMKKYGYRGDNLIPALFTETGRGLMTTKAIQTDDTIVSIPKALLITTQTVLDSDLGDYIKRHTTVLTPLQTLCVFLMFEKAKGCNSTWQPYISVLPETYSTPTYFNQSELSCLPSFLQLQADSQGASVKNAFEGMKSLLFTLETKFAFCHGALLYEDFRWAWFVINTRSVYMKHAPCDFLTSDDNTYALVPLLDLLNHSPTVEVNAAYNKESQYYEIKTSTPYKRYDQVFICYGPHENAKLLLEYGFIVPNNPHNVVSFDIDVLIQCLNTDQQSQQSHDAFLERKQQILYGNNLTSDLSCNLDGLSWRLQTVLRILCMDFNELNSWKRVLSGEECSKQTETKSKQLAVHVCENVQEEVQQLMQMTEHLPSTPHTYLISSLCKERKCILEKCLQTMGS